MQFFEDIKVGMRREIGSFTFTTENIKAFAAEFDPQPFHLDEEAGRKSLFGGLVASGWHLGAVGMKLLVANGKKITAEMRARGEEVAVWGPSPGFTEMRWHRPVFPGDTLTYSGTIETARLTASRPGWGIVQSRNSSTNQRGELVMSFLATAFAPCRSK